MSTGVIKPVWAKEALTLQGPMGPVTVLAYTCSAKSTDGRMHKAAVMPDQYKNLDYRQQIEDRIVALATGTAVLKHDPT